MKDERNYLYLEMLRILKDKKPKFFVAENVKGILSLEKGEVIKMILEDFKKIGYQVDYKLLVASDYGIPQHRERVIIIGNRIGKQNPFPKPSDGRKISTKEAVEHLANVRTRDKPFLLGNKMIYNHVARTNVDKFWARKT